MANFLFPLQKEKQVPRRYIRCDFSIVTYGTIDFDFIPLKKAIFVVRERRTYGRTDATSYRDA